MEKGPIRRKDRVGKRNLSSGGHQGVMLTGGKRKDYSRNTKNDSEPDWPSPGTSQDFKHREWATNPAT